MRLEVTPGNTGADKRTRKTRGDPVRPEAGLRMLMGILGESFGNLCITY